MGINGFANCKSQGQGKVPIIKGLCVEGDEPTTRNEDGEMARFMGKEKGNENTVDRQMEQYELEGKIRRLEGWEEKLEEQAAVSDELRALINKQEEGLLALREEIRIQKDINGQLQVLVKEAMQGWGRVTQKLEKEIKESTDKMANDIRSIARQELAQMVVKLDTAQKEWNGSIEKIEGSVEVVRKEVLALRDDGNRSGETTLEENIRDLSYKDRLGKKEELSTVIRKEVVDRALPLLKQEMDRNRSIIISGVGESPVEQGPERERVEKGKVRHLLHAIEKGWAFHEISNIIRLGNYGDHDYRNIPRMVKVTFRDEATANAVLSNSRALKRSSSLSHIYIRRDLPKDTRIKFREVLREVRAKNESRTEQQKNKFFWRVGKKLEPHKVIIEEGINVGGGNTGIRQMSSILPPHGPQSSCQAPQTALYH